MRAPLSHGGARRAHGDGLLQLLDLHASLRHRVSRVVDLRLDVPDGPLEPPPRGLGLVDALLQGRAGLQPSGLDDAFDRRNELRVLVPQRLRALLLVDGGHVQAHSILQPDLLVAVGHALLRSPIGAPRARRLRRMRASVACTGRLRALQEAAVRRAQAQLVRMQRLPLVLQVLDHLIELPLERRGHGLRDADGVAKFPLRVHDRVLLSLQGHFDRVPNLLAKRAPLALRDAPDAELQPGLLRPQGRLHRRQRLLRLGDRVLQRGRPGGEALRELVGVVHLVLEAGVQALGGVEVGQRRVVVRLRGPGRLRGRLHAGLVRLRHIEGGVPVPLLGGVHGREEGGATRALRR
mmetsp:Transcript_99568/g.257293  ORF Transcript_99568/g.257293 Transcript_99568/m.257293 type:complete len:350 (-) Transcript_99568:153-1202(-)